MSNKTIIKEFSGKFWKHNLRLKALYLKARGNAPGLKMNYKLTPCKGKSHISSLNLMPLQGAEKGTYNFTRGDAPGYKIKGFQPINK